MNKNTDLTKVLLMGFGVVSILVGAVVTVIALLKKSPKFEDDFED